MVRGPMAQGFFDIARLIGKGVLFSSSGKSAKTLSRAERKAQGAVDTARLRREELAGLGVLLAFVALPVALYAAHTLGLGKGGVSIEKLRASDAALDEGATRLAVINPAVGEVITEGGVTVVESTFTESGGMGRLPLLYRG